MTAQIVDKPWGHEEIWAHTDKYVGKILFIKSAHRLSYQYHNTKDETIRVLDGEMRFEYEENRERKDIVLKPGDTFHVPPKTKHRMEALKDCLVLEVSTPELDDVVRLEDDYNR